jgi:hypothetical protein
MAQKYRTPRFDIIAELQAQIRDLRARVTSLENAKTVTVPIYAKSSLGTRDLVLGQIFIGKDNTFNYVTGTPDQVSVYEVNGNIYSF